MKILAISGSARVGRMTHSAVNALLEGCTDDFEIISLAGKKINGCLGCAACAGDNKCKVCDDFNEIADKMEEADIIIFGAPNYFGTINALAHAVLERTFCFRHRDRFILEGKLGVIVTTCESREIEDPVAALIDRNFFFNHIETIGRVQTTNYNQCYTCGYGHSCIRGAVARKHGLLEEILPCHLPKEVACQDETMQQIVVARASLKEHGVTFW